MRPYIPTTDSDIPSDPPNQGSAAKDKIDPIEARLIEIRDALKQITKLLIEMQRQTRNAQRAA